MAAFSTVDALRALCTSIPDWSARLDHLNGQISLRQIELARLEEEREERRTPRSLRNKGSTESLRPRDGHEANLPEEEAEDAEDLTFHIQSLKPRIGGVVSPKLPDGRASVVTPSPSTDYSSPNASPAALMSRQSSQPTPPTQSRLASAVLKKRKTESLASGESPKYRTRSMIIVYYDSTVQTAFEELVKFVSGSRNAMRKGKMAAKMAEMRRAAELEAEADDDDEDLFSPALLAAQKNAFLGRPVPGKEDTGEGYLAMPKLPRTSSYKRADQFGSTLSFGLLRGYRRGGADGSAPDIFDELDKGLEWCQSQCERAAHQFLRDGECNQDITNIKKKLWEVKETSSQELERLKKEEAEAPLTPDLSAVRKMAPSGVKRELKNVQMRKDTGPLKVLEVDDMEVDEDEGCETMELPKLIFKRSRDVSNH